MSATPTSNGAPLSYPAPLSDDYTALRHGVGALLVGRDVVRVSGSDAAAYLQGQCSQDVESLDIGMSADALLLTPRGKLQALVRVTRAAHDEFFLDVDSGYGGTVIERLARFKLRVQVDIESVDWHIVSLRGPDAAVFFDAGPGPPPGTSFVVPYTWGRVTGVDLLGPGPEIPKGVRSCGSDAWQALRVEAGIPLMGAELDERTLAAEADLLERCVSFTKGCYTGQELVARLDARGNKVARRLRGIVIDPAPGEGWKVRPGAEVSTGQKVVGQLTSVAWSPEFESTIALCYLHRDVQPPCAVEVGAGGADHGPVCAQALALPLI